METSSVASKLFALLRFLPRPGIILVLGFPLQTHQSSPTGQQSHQATDGKSHAVASSQAEEQMPGRGCNLAENTHWSWSVGAQLGSSERDQAGVC